MKKIRNTKVIVVIENGDGAYCLNGIWHEVMPGDVRLCPPGTHITSRLHFRCDTIYFDIGAPETVVHHPIFADFPLYFHAGEDFEEDFAKIIHAYNADTLTAPLLQKRIIDGTACAIVETVSC